MNALQPHSGSVGLADRHTDRQTEENFLTANTCCNAALFNTYNYFVIFHRHSPTLRQNPPEPGKNIVYSLYRKETRSPHSTCTLARRRFHKRGAKIRLSQQCVSTTGSRGSEAWRRLAPVNAPKLSRSLSEKDEIPNPRPQTMHLPCCSVERTRRRRQGRQTDAHTLC